jgi:hypothetical protein
MVWVPKYSPLLKDFAVQKSLKPAGLSGYGVKKALTTALTLISQCTQITRHLSEFPDNLGSLKSPF